MALESFLKLGTQVQSYLILGVLAVVGLIIFGLFSVFLPFLTTMMWGIGLIIVGIVMADVAREQKWLVAVFSVAGLVLIGWGLLAMWGILPPTFNVMSFSYGSIASLTTGSMAEGATTTIEAEGIAEPSTNEIIVALVTIIPMIFFYGEFWSRVLRQPELGKKRRRR